jgi:hypothetical protein
VRVRAVLLVRKIDELPEHPPIVDGAHLNHHGRSLPNGVAGVQAASVAGFLPVFFWVAPR